MGYNFKTWHHIKKENMEIDLHKMNLHYYIDNIIQMHIVKLDVLQKKIGYRQKNRGALEFWKACV